MKKLLILLLCTVLLTSCSAGDVGQSNGDEGGNKLPKCASYGTKDVSYTVEIADARATVTLNAERTEGITIATVVSPEELAGTVVTDDVEGMRILLTDGAELPLSLEGAKGLSAVLALYLPLPEDTVATGEGEVEFSTNGYAARLRLTEDGYPDTATLSRNNSERLVKFTRNE